MIKRVSGVKYRGCFVTRNEVNASRPTPFTETLKRAMWSKDRKKDGKDREIEEGGESERWRETDGERKMERVSERDSEIVTGR